MSLKNKLLRYKQHLNKNEDQKSNKLNIEISEINSNDHNERVDKEIEIPFLEEWKKIGVKPYIYDGQYSLVKEKVFPINSKRGKYRFSDIQVATEHWNKSNINHPLSNKGIQLSDMIFFDTETTGLGGGTGTYIFLLSYARVLEDKVILRQHLLPEPGYEVALYHGFLSEIGKSINLLTTYNGKAFDWPQVKTRHILIRDQVPHLPSFGHFDLLHASRRLWKEELESVKLSIVEKEILGIEREDDVPGFLAPMIYQDFVQTKELTGILKIMEHNEDDVLSLIILYTHLSYQLLGIDHQQTSSEKFAVGKWYSQLKETNQAISVLENAARQDDGAKKWSGQYELSLAYKKLKKYEDASKCWIEIVNNCCDWKIKINACIELAKYFEHIKKDFQTALCYSQIALKECQLIKENGKLETELIKRITRLETKLANNSV